MSNQRVSLASIFSFEAHNEEIEKTFYIEPESTDMLDKAESVKEQTQCVIPIWGLKEEVIGQTRVRRIVEKNHTSYFICAKCTTGTTKNGISQRKEVEEPTTEDMFSVYESIAPVKTNRRRYVFKVADTENTHPRGEGLFSDGSVGVEVDVFLDAKMQPLPLFKLDVEVPNESVWELVKGKVLAMFPHRTIIEDGADERVRQLYQSNDLGNDQVYTPPFAKE